MSRLSEDWNVKQGLLRRVKRRLGGQESLKSQLDRALVELRSGLIHLERMIVDLETRASQNEDANETREVLEIALQITQILTRCELRLLDVKDLSDIATVVARLSCTLKRFELRLLQELPRAHVEIKELFDAVDELIMTTTFQPLHSGDDERELPPDLRGAKTSENRKEPLEA